MVMFQYNYQSEVMGYENDLKLHNVPKQRNMPSFSTVLGQVAGRYDFFLVELTMKQARTSWTQTKLRFLISEMRED